MNLSLTFLLSPSTTTSTSLLVWAVGLSVMQLEVEATKSGVYGGLLQNPCVHYSVVHTHTHTHRGMITYAC